METERLQRLVALLRSDVVTDEQFNLRSWHCGTASCAVGWAMFDPWFNEQGLGHADTRVIQPLYETGDEDLTGWDAVTVFFGLEDHQAEYLFSGDSYENCCATRFEVADRIEAFLEQAK